MPLMLLVVTVTCFLTGCPMTSGGPEVKPEPAVTIH